MLRLLNRSSLRTMIHHIPNLDLTPSVGGTAKGKKQLKEGQQLKRSVVRTKKKAVASSAGSGGGRGRGKQQQIRQLENMVESCLNAPTLVRHLTAKERKIEREKLGLISKERQREIDIAKKRKLEPNPVIIGTPGLDLISFGLVDADKIPKYELTVEDVRRLAKEYSRVLMWKHRAKQKAETTLLRLKKEAIAALPDKLREKASVPDLIS